MRNANGFFEKCAFAQECDFNNTVQLFECYSSVPANGSPDFSISSGDIIVRDWHGSFRLNSCTSGFHSIEVYGGRAIIQPGVVAGDGVTGAEVALRGQPFSIANNATGDTTHILDQTEGTKVREIHEDQGLNPDAPITIDEDGSVTSLNIVKLAVTTGTSPNRQTTLTRQ